MNTHIHNATALLEQVNEIFDDAKARAKVLIQEHASRTLTDEERVALEEHVKEVSEHCDAAEEHAKEAKEAAEEVASQFEAAQEAAESADSDMTQAQDALAGAIEIARKAGIDVSEYE